MVYQYAPSPRSRPPMSFYKQSTTLPIRGDTSVPGRHIMVAEVDGPPVIAEPATMQPPNSKPTGVRSNSPLRQFSVHSTSTPVAARPSTNTNKRRQSRFDPMGNDMPDDEGYGELSHRHPFRHIEEETTKESFTLPGIKSLLNPSSERDSTSSTPSLQSPSLPSLVSSNSPSGSPSTMRTSRYSSLTSGSSASDSHHGWWAPDFERAHSNSFHPRSQSFPRPPPLDDHEDKRRRSDQPPSVRDQDDLARLRWMSQSRNASYPIATSGPSSPGLMHPPAPPSALMSRGSISHQEPPIADRRPSAVPRSLSLVSGPLSKSFGDLSATERERQGSMSSEMPPPFPSPLTFERKGSALQAEMHRQRAATATPPDRFRSQASPGLPDARSNSNPVSHRSSLSEQIKAQSGDGLSMASASGRYDNSLTVPERTFISEHPSATGWQPSRRSSSSSTKSTSTPVMTVTLNSDDGHDPTPVNRSRLSTKDRDGADAMMSGMDVLAESARRVSEEEHNRLAGQGHMDDGEDSPRPGPGGPKYQCAYCTKTFSRPSSLRIHTYSHTGERPFVCQEPSCGRRFSVQSNLKRHAKVHQLGQAGGASLHQLHMPLIPPRGPGPGPGAPFFAHGHVHAPPQGGFGYPRSTGPYAQPQPPHHQAYADARYGEEDEMAEEDELDEDEDIKLD